MLCSSWMTCPWDLNRRKHNYTAFFPCLHGRPSCPGTLLLRWCTVKGGSPSDWSTTGDRANWNAAGAADRKEEEWSCGAFNSKLKHIESLNPQAVCSPLAVNSWRGRWREREGLNPLSAKGSWFMLLKWFRQMSIVFFWMQGIMYSRELLIKSRRLTTWYFTVRGGVRRHPRKQCRFLLCRQSCVGRCSFALLRCEGICKLSTSLSMHIPAYIDAGVCAASDAYKLIWSNMIDGFWGFVLVPPRRLA